MSAAPSVLPEVDRLDAAGLKALIFSQHEQLLSHRSEIEHLKLPSAKLRRLQFGRKSEKLEPQIEQPELKLEELELTKTCPTREFRSELAGNGGNLPVFTRSPLTADCPF